MNLICGINPVLEALGAGTRHFDRLLVVKGLRNRRISEAISRAGNLGIPLRFEARETLDRMAGGIPHQGLIAVVSAKPVISVEKLLEEAHTPALVVVLDGVEDPRNLGAILRTVEAAGADGVLLPDRHSAGLSETVSRASAGGLEHVRVAGIGNVVQSIEALKARGLWVVGFDASGTERWDTVDYRRPIALVLGGEGRGIRRLVREHCDHLVSIPLFGHVNSLNVSVAAGIALYEVVRQRGVVPSHVRPIPIRAAASPRIVGPAAEDGEVDPGHVAADTVEEGEYEDDASRAELVGLSDDEDRPAWAGPTVLKAVGGVRRDHGGRGGRPGHGHDHGRDRGRGRAHRRDGGRGPGGGHDETRGRPPAAPPEDARGEAPSAAAPGGAPRGPRRRRRRGGKPHGGPRPAGASGETGPRTGGPDDGGDHSGEGGGREHDARRTHAGGPPHDGAAGSGGSSERSPNDAPGGFQKRRRRRRRRH